MVGIFSLSCSILTALSLWGGDIFFIVWCSKPACSNIFTFLNGNKVRGQLTLGSIWCICFSIIAILKTTTFFNWTKERTKWARYLSYNNLNEKTFWSKLSLSLLCIQLFNPPKLCVISKFDRHLFNTIFLYIVDKSC